MERRVMGGPYRTPDARDDVAVRRLRARSASIARRFRGRRRRAAFATWLVGALARLAAASAACGVIAGLALALTGEPAPWIGPSLLVVTIGGGMIGVFSLARPR